MKKWSVLVGFLPWVLFFLFYGDSSISKEIATIVALVSHVLLNHKTIRKFFVLDIGACTFFILFAVNIFIFKYQVITDNGYLISSLVLALIAWISLIIKKPFTLQYASLNVSREIQASRLFVMINYILTFIWAILLTLMILPIELQNYLSLQYRTDINMGVSLAFVILGIFITNKFPDWFVGKMSKKKFNIDIKKLYQDNRTDSTDFTNFNTTKIFDTYDFITDVVIVGAGPIGLTSALLLQQFGVNAIIVEKHSGTSIHPKSRGISCRSMELFRKLGIEQDVKEYNLPDSQSWFGWFSTLTGKIHAKIVKHTDYKSISPTFDTNVAQTYLEKVMLEKLQKLNQQILFHHQVTDFSQNAEIVQLQLYDLNTQEKRILQAKYIIAADGAHSTIRQLLKIPMIGPDEINVVFSVYCEINMEHILEEEKHFGLAFIVNPDGPSPMVLSIDGKNKWMFMFPSAGTTATKLKEIYTDEYIKAKINAIIGCENPVPINIISKQTWSLSSQIANQIIAGRTFLLGDSMHRFSPSGGMGMNTGLQDVDNLIWKLAFVIHGVINPKVLESYAEERIPSVLDNMEWSLLNLQRIVQLQKNFNKENIEDTDFATHAKEQDAHLNKSGLDLGVIYKSSIIAKTNELKPIIPTDQYIQNTYVGSRLPHVELVCDGQVISSLDLVTIQFIFLYLEPGDVYLERIDFKSIPLQKICLNNAKSNIYEVKNGEVQKLLLANEFIGIWVRPDGHIAWKGALNQQSSLQQLEETISLMAI